MKGLGKAIAALLAAAGILAGLSLVTSCVIGGRGEGVISLLITDGPQNDWREVSIILESVQAYNESTNAWHDIWIADPANPDTGKINLVTLGGVSLILGNATVTGGTYDQIKITFDPDPAGMTLVDDSGLTIAAGNIIVTDPGGLGEILVDLDPPVRLVDGETENLQLDFDLAHPLSIVRIDSKVVLNFQVRSKALPADVDQAQFARALGDVTAAAVEGTSFTIESVHGAETVFGVDVDTTYYDADTGQPGSFAALASLVDGGGALVASSLTADGGHTARSVWYAGDAATLPDVTPEGLIRLVGADRITMSKLIISGSPGAYRSDYGMETIRIDAGTSWTFKGLSMGTGLGVLPFIDEGFRIEVTLVDPAASPRVAGSVNVTSASADGVVASATLQNFVLGDSMASGIQAYSTADNHKFEWMFFELESSPSTSIQGFVDVANKAAAANFRLAGTASLHWDVTNDRWVVEDFVLDPVRLHDLTQISTGYTEAAGTMVLSTYDPWDNATPQDLTVLVDAEGDFQTLVGSLVLDESAGTSTYTYPVPVTEWAALLTPGLSAVKGWVRAAVATDGTLTWHAQTLLAKTANP